jgi:hypothetical protein
MSEDLKIKRFYGLNRSSFSNGPTQDSQNGIADQNDKESTQSRIDKLKEQAGSHQTSLVANAQQLQTNSVQEMFLKKKSLAEGLANKLGETIPNLSKSNIDDILNKLLEKVKQMSPEERVHSGIQELLDTFKDSGMRDGLIIPQLSTIEDPSPEKYLEISETRKKPPSVLPFFQKRDDNDLEFLSLDSDKFKSMPYLHESKRN